MDSSGYTAQSMLADGMHPIVTSRVMPSLPQRIWSESNWERIEAGGPRHGCGTRWNARCRDDVLYLYRSQTGYGIYEATFMPTSNGDRKISRAVIESHAQRYTSPSVKYDCLVLELVISAVLLDEPVRELRSAMTRMMRAMSGVADMPSQVAEYSVLGISSS
ncbi:hypothetical protein [Streptomyces sp. NPDC094468]|uniref:hypothetical protein n=1 Tax=Streptomyces sp. NPDC094468 TaxID=3366066 RepID=UPI0037F3A8BE